MSDIEETLNRIFKLGFWISIEWNESFSIYYNANDVIPSTAYSVNILNCSYYKSQFNIYTYLVMVETCCDFFYEWYNKNLKIISKFDNESSQDALNKLEDVCLGDITKRVARELNLTDILNLFENKKTSKN
jgi:hypothetical protein